MKAQLLFLLCILVLGRAAVILNDCQFIDALHGELLYDNRVTYMREYFPINYKLYVKYEEVLRCQNITTLINEGISVQELRYLWGIVNENILETVQGVLPQQHPTRPYITRLQKLFKALLREKDEEKQVEKDQIQDILKRLRQSNDKVKEVLPKALLDNCYKVMYALYEEECRLCNPRSDVEDTLCPPGTLPELSSPQRTSCKS